MKPDWTVTTSDGWRLGVKVTEPTGTPRGDVLLLHAMMVDARTLDRPYKHGLATVLASAGYRVHRADFRGRGMSPGKRAYLYEDLVYRDLPALVGELQNPWVVGHSLGGHVAAAAWGQGTTIRGLVGLGSNIWLPSLERSVVMRAKKSMNMAVIRSAAAVFPHLPVRRAGMGTVDESAEYARDLARFWRTDSWSDRAGTDWLGPLGGIQGPVLMVISDGDELFAHPTGARAWAAHFGDPTIWQLSHEPEMPAPNHMELGIEGVSTPLWHRIADWMKNADH